MAADCNCFLKRLAAWIRTLLSFEILRSVHTCVRRFRTHFHKIPQGDFIEWWLPLKRYPSVCDNGASSVIYCLVEMNRFLVEFFFPIYIFLMEWIFSIEIKCLFFLIERNCKCSRLSLNGHLYKTDTSVKRTPRVGPCPCLFPLFDSL